MSSLAADWHKSRARDNTPLSPAEKRRIRADFESVTGREFASSFNPNCPNRYNDALINIIRMENTKKRGGYTLKRGVVINKNGKRYTNKDLTAAVAEWYIAQDLNNRGKFEHLAKEWDDYDTNSK